VPLAFTVPPVTIQSHSDKPITVTIERDQPGDASRIILEPKKL